MTTRAEAENAQYGKYVDSAILVGYAHASLIGSLRPDIAYPHRAKGKGRIPRAKAALTTVTAKPCQCPDDHVEVWVIPVSTDDGLQSEP
jgi:hypothetical protein